MSKEVLQAIKAICDEKHIPVESVLATIEQALAAAYRKDFGNRLQNLKVEFNPETMGMRVFDVKTVVEDQVLEEEGGEGVERIRGIEREEKGEESKLAAGPSEQAATVKESVKKEAVEEQGASQEPAPAETPAAVEQPTPAEVVEEEKRFNPKTEIMLSEARLAKPDAQLGEEIVTELPVPGEFGRMAAQTAKQVIIQRLREAERDVIFAEYKGKEGQMVNGTIQRVEGATVLVDIGQATAVMPMAEQVRSERYAPGAPSRFYIKSVSIGSRGPEVVVSRADRELVRALFAMEVPEISEGTVEIKSIAREPGSRTKIAVASKQENVDPVGSCVGQRGSRVQFIINELSGEKIDIIEWQADEAAFIKSALSPAKVVSVELKPELRQASAFVNEDQLSLAIGKQGQNVRLASALTGWRIDIKQAGQTAPEPAEAIEAPAADTAEPAASESTAKTETAEAPAAGVESTKVASAEATPTTVAAEPETKEPA